MQLKSKTLLKYTCLVLILCLIVSCNPENDSNEGNAPGKIERIELETFIQTEMDFSDTVKLKQQFTNQAWEIVSYYYIHMAYYSKLTISSFFHHLMESGVIDYGKFNGEPCTCFTKTTRRRGAETLKSSICFRKVNGEIKVVYLNHAK